MTVRLKAEGGPAVKISAFAINIRSFSALETFNLDLPDDSQGSIEYLMATKLIRYVAS